MDLTKRTHHSSPSSQMHGGSRQSLGLRLQCRIKWTVSKLARVPIALRSIYPVGAVLPQPQLESASIAISARAYGARGMCF